MPRPSSDRIAPSERVYTALRDAVLHGEYAPHAPLRTQELARTYGVSLAVVREALLRLVGEGLAERLQNRGFVVPAASAERWQQVAEARAVVEPAALRLAIERGDLEWEARVRATSHRLAGTPPYDGGTSYSDAWSEAHRTFHRTLLEGCGNTALLEAADRLWSASELARRWSSARAPQRDADAEHGALEEAVLDRDAARAAQVLVRHVGLTASALTEA